MNDRFIDLLPELRACLNKLADCVAVVGATSSPFPKMTKGEALRGVYLFSEHGKHLYVGRSNRIPARYRDHWKTSASVRQAAFAVRLAREASGALKATYRKGEGSLSALARDEAFDGHFQNAKRRISQMEFRWVQQDDPILQCLLEIYVHLTLQTQYNDFDNH